MNPLLLLLGIFGTGALMALGRDDDDGKNIAVLSKTPGDDDDMVSAPISTPHVADKTPEAPEQTGSAGDDAPPPPLGGETVDVMAGRVATLAAPSGDVTGIQILSAPAHGSLTVNPDNSLALVMTMSDYVGTQSVRYAATHADGSVTEHEVALNVVPGLEEQGWGTGATHYMLGTDESDHIVVEHGEGHVEIYVSASDSALTLADIATMEGLPVSSITGHWLAQHGGYGTDPATALAQDAGLAMFQGVVPTGTRGDASLLFERGYEYDKMGSFLINTGGETAANPMLIAAWGSGEAPDITTKVDITGSENIVLQGVQFGAGINALEVENLLFDDVIFHDGLVAVQMTSGVTFRNSDFHDAYLKEPIDGEWGPFSYGALYVGDVDGLLLENNWVDHSGWGEGWETGDGMTPTKFSHNFYLQYDNTDVTARDNIIMRAASVGMQVRSGGYIEDNVFLDNNFAVNSNGGKLWSEEDAAIGNYTLFADNLVTSAGFRHHADYNGAAAGAIHSSGEYTTLLDNIVTHLRDPNNPEEDLYKLWTDDMVTSHNSFYDDTITYKWQGNGLYSEEHQGDRNIDGLDTGVLDQTTIQLFTAQLLGMETATIADLADYLRAEAYDLTSDVVDADLIIRYFQESFGIAPDLRTTAETLRFVPDDLGDGVRWDNRINWSTEDLPGTIAGDSVDLGGNHVVYGGNSDIDMMEFGDGGQLDVHNGRLDVGGGLTTSGAGGTLAIDYVGQVWAEGHNGTGLDVTVDEHGRFANTGEAEDIDLAISGGQAILATDGAEYDLDAGHSLSIFDAAAKVGFDGQNGGIAILDMHEGGKLAFSAASGDLGEISEFRSGAFGDTPDVLSGIDLGGATLEIDLVGLSAEAGNVFTLMSADELVGLIDEATLSIGGLGARDATIVVDYLSDTVRLELTAGSGAVGVTTVGGMADHEAGEDALWQALTADHGTVSESADDIADDEFSDLAA